jgi:hypothetical protein
MAGAVRMTSNFSCTGRTKAAFIFSQPASRAPVNTTLGILGTAYARLTPCSHVDTVH